MAKQKKSVGGGGADSPESAISVAHPDEAGIAALAYQLWLARGSPVGSDQEDWFQAESMLSRQSEEEPPVSK
jgi:hypothetical protein